MIAMLLMLLAQAPAPAASPAGNVLMLRCHMSECGWQQLLSREVVRRGDGYVLHRLTVLHGTSVHRPTRRGRSTFPSRYGRGVPIAWHQAASETYVLCSRAFPAVVFRSDGRDVAHRLNFFDMYGFAYSSAYIYLDACHGLGRDALENEARLRRLGYSAIGETEQIELSSPQAILERLPR